MRLAGMMHEGTGGTVSTRGGERTFFLLTLGCPKNEVDSDVIASLLLARGWEMAAGPEEASLILVNTCSFIVPAVRESVEAIMDLGGYKAREGKRLAVAGCLVSRYGEKILRELLPEVDVFAAPHRYADLPALLEGVDEGGGTRPAARDFSSTLSKGYVYVKIAEGCDRRCSYCTIPSIRGPLRSRPPAEIREEACRFLEEGARELVLVAQDTTSYGRDLFGEPSLPALLEELLALPGDYRLRLMYMHPAGVDEAVLASMQHPRMQPYLDLPLQHVDEGILRRMGRWGGREEYRGLLERIRERLPGAALRATFMLGFPGEDERSFAALRAFLEEMRFDWLGLFGYSQEEGTAAYPLGAGCRPGVVERRLEEIRALQEEIMCENAGRMLGRKLLVLVEGESEEAPGFWEARSYREAPEIDGVIFLPATEGLRAGSWCEVLVEATEGIDLIAAPLAKRVDRRDNACGG